MKSTTITNVRLSRRSTRRLLEAGADLFPEDTHAGRPVTRGDCAALGRPCPYVGCRFNLYADVNPRTGSLKLNFAELEPGDLSASCALDIADEGPQSFEFIGALMNVTKERVRQLEESALRKLGLDRDLEEYREANA